MTRQQPTDPDQRTGGPERAAEGGTAEGTTAADRGSEPGPVGEEWADEAAQARTSSDPRRVAPHDRSGVPSTGDTR